MLPLAYGHAFARPSEIASLTLEDIRRRQNSLPARGKKSEHTIEDVAAPTNVYVCQGTFGRWGVIRRARTMAMAFASCFTSRQGFAPFAPNKVYNLFRNMRRNSHAGGGGGGGGGELEEAAPIRTS